MPMDAWETCLHFDDETVVRATTHFLRYLMAVRDGLNTNVASLTDLALNPGYWPRR